MKHEHAARFDKLLQILAPEILSIAIDSAAIQRFQSKSDYIRAAVIDRLRTPLTQPSPNSESSEN